MNPESVLVMPAAERPIAIVPPYNQPLSEQPVFVDPCELTPLLSYEGLPKGSEPALILRCIELLEHVAKCDSEFGKCPEGGGCMRTKQVLAHSFHCIYMKMNGGNGCNVCKQLLALCRNHSNRCEARERNCAVLNCKNNQKRKVTVNCTQVQLNTPVKVPSRYSKEEFQHVIKKLSEAIDLPTTPLKLKGIENLLKTNHQATAQVLRYILKKKQKSQLISHQMINLTARG